MKLRWPWTNTEIDTERISDADLQRFVVACENAAYDFTRQASIGLDEQAKRRARRTDEGRLG